jgi:hypothetical protein
MVSDSMKRPTVVLRAVLKAYHKGPPVERLGNGPGLKAAGLFPLLLLLLAAPEEFRPALGAVHLERGKMFSTSVCS